MRSYSFPTIRPGCLYHWSTQWRKCRLNREGNDKWNDYNRSGTKQGCCASVSPPSCFPKANKSCLQSEKCFPDSNHWLITACTVLSLHLTLHHSKAHIFARENENEQSQKQPENISGCRTLIGLRLLKQTRLLNLSAQNNFTLQSSN